MIISVEKHRQTIKLFTCSSVLTDGKTIERLKVLFKVGSTLSVIDIGTQELLILWLKEWIMSGVLRHKKDLWSLI
jgi:hypothetical protein